MEQIDRESEMNKNKSEEERNDFKNALKRPYPKIFSVEMKCNI